MTLFYSVTVIRSKAQLTLQQMGKLAQNSAFSAHFTESDLHAAFQRTTDQSFITFPQFCQALLNLYMIKFEETDSFGEFIAQASGN